MRTGSAVALIADGNLLLAALVALAAGAVSFASPCVLPLVPGFLGYVTGMSPGAGEARAARRRTLAGALGFVAGFSVVFITGTLLASAAGAALRAHAALLTRAGGVLVIALALVFLGAGAQWSWTPRWRPAAGVAGAPLLGMVFGIGWAPCVGPAYAVIYALATNLAGDSGLIARGALLGVAYCLGLGVPFVLIATGWQRALRASAWLRARQRAVQLAGGLLLMAVGVLLVTGLWDQLVRHLQASLVSSFRTVL